MQTINHVFERTLTESDTKHNLVHVIDVPAGTQRLDVRLSYAPHQVGDYHNMLTLTVIGPSGFRGAGHRHGDHHHIHLSAAAASPGFLSGPIEPGPWQVVVDTHQVLPGAPCVMRLDVSGHATDADAAAPSPPPTVSPSPSRNGRRGPGWYRGDLHAHTTHSDACWGAADLAAFARARGLDFITLSDHNTTAGLPEMAVACGDDLTLVPAQELTTFHGHALALGLNTWVDWRTTPGGRDIATIAAEVEARGGLFVIAHPRSIGDPYCTGCAWTHLKMQPGTARLVEVWNNDWGGDSHNEDGLATAMNWLGSGHRLVFTAGTDHHGREEGQHFGFNVVMADRLAPNALLAAIKQGHLYLSSGPQLDFEAVVDGESAMMGDSLTPSDGAAVQLVASWRDCPSDARVELIVDGEVAGGCAVSAGSTHVWGRTAGDAHWCLVAIRAADGVMLALSNPIYLDGR